ncbi:hypothetical protein FACS1894154_10260 [Betaproteobacteria bacterium]|nr:hypothetical protein FACS1894154_10260 [Betaproteobacteria bacterium]GHU30361.1 hypothetical protein FACS189497_10010 [Betaproteobacteria bacterium]
MQSNTISQYLNLVNLQIAAEAFLVEDDKDYKSVKTGKDLTDGSFLRSILAETFFRENLQRRSWLIVCIIISTIGYLLSAPAGQGVA